MRLVAWSTMAVLLVGCAGQAPATPTLTPTSPRSTPTSTATVEPEPTIDEQALGVITFGDAFDPETLLIPEPKSRFPATVPHIAWSAQFSEAGGATTLTFLLARITPGTATTVIKGDLPWSDPDHSLLLNIANVAGILDNQPGDYVMRYFRGTTLLAEGLFTLE